jgi:hypothetical protein
MTKNKTLYRLTWAALLTLIVTAASIYSGDAEGSQYTASLGDTKNYGGVRDIYAERVIYRPGVYEFDYQINVIDGDSLTSFETTQIHCYLEIDGKRRHLLGYSVMARSNKATPDQQGVGAISGTLRAHAHEYAIMYCDTSNDYGVIVLVSRLYKRFMR